MKYPEEALPDEAVFVRTLGPNEVWRTERWQYLVESGTRKVLNIARIEPEELD